MRFDPQQEQTNNRFVVSRNPTSKSQSVSMQHTRTHTQSHNEYNNEKTGHALGRPTKQDQNPTVGHQSFTKGSDSPPSVSLTASPEKTTEKKLTNLSVAAK